MAHQRAAKVNQLDSPITFLFRTEEKVLRLQITVNDLVLLQEDEALQYLNCVVPDFIGREADKASCFQVLKQVSVKQFKNEAVMLSEVCLVDHSHDVVLVIWIFLHNVFQILSFFIRELVIHLCISRNLHRKLLLTF